MEGMSIDPLNLFVIEKQIAKGGFGEIFKAHAEDGKSYVIKRIPKKNKDQQSNNFVREVRAGFKLSHKNVVNYITEFTDPLNEYLVFEFVEGLDLFAYMSKERQMDPLKEKDAKKMFKQLVEAVHYCHARGVVHLDIKLDNIMFNPATGVAKLIDFGLCDFITESNNGYFTRNVGSEEYCPPELLAKKRSPYDGRKADVWCLGVVLYALLSTKFPLKRC
eukprot:TRINITY_DN43429_c0_g1_i1.p1 TRINITY_DN43429_c0_g1~~TRINITY_DN43429_c0_g1_i1.p1  ORF type:complete len:219 (+),score=68.19 TRINITY_DN43429_c0_g1_i1:127-783(+)